MRDNSDGAPRGNPTIGKKVLRGTLVITLVGVLAKLTSFLAEAILAAYLGTSYQSDAYYMVSSIQAVLYPMLSVGIWNVFLPIYKEKLATGRLEDGNALTDQVLTFFSMASLAAVVLLIFFAEQVVSVIAPGFQGRTKTLCVELVRIAAPMYIFILDAAIYASVLQCHNKFLGSQIREIASHVPTIVCALLLYRRFGIKSLAAALVAGGAIRLLIELPFVDWGYRFRPSFRFQSEDFRRIIKRLPSALISEGVTQLNTLVDKAMASALPEGTISGLNYGHKLMNVFSGLLSTAISTALYPQLVELIALKKREELSRLLVKILSIFQVLMVPVTIACVLFRRELVGVVYQRGSFDQNSAALTSGVFACYCLGILFIACNTVLNNLFFGYGDTRTPMGISIANLLINVGLNLLLIRLWGVNGLALATSLSAFLTFLIRMVAARRYAALDFGALLGTGLKVLLASAVACVLPRALFWVWHVPNAAALVLAAVMGVALYYGMNKLLRISEIDDVLALLRKRRAKRS